MPRDPARRLPRRLTATLAVALVALIVAGCGDTAPPSGPIPTPGPSADASAVASAPAVPTPVPTPRPAPGHEVYGFLPYWELDDDIAAHVADTDLTTLALFSVASRRDGTLATTQNGYRRVTGEIGRRLIREAHDRGIRVELVYTSFGSTRNSRFFGGPAETRTAVIGALVDLAADLHVDGINVDVEVLDPTLIPAYGAFVGELRTAVKARQAKDQVSVATTANLTGAAMAAAAATAGADRIFLMGYDYHWAGSDPGASAPMDRLDGDEKDLVWSLDTYESFGVPVDRTLLGLPLYGMTWPVEGAEPGAVRTGKGDTWIPSDHLDRYADPSFVPSFEPVEVVDVYTQPVATDDGEGWERIYVDSATTLAPKLQLADDRGLAGAGFWAIGYERGFPDITKLIRRFAAGELAPT